MYMRRWRSNNNKSSSLFSTTTLPPSTRSNIMHNIKYTPLFESQTTKFSAKILRVTYATPPLTGRQKIPKS